jgi:hypothetical protein
VGPAERKVKRAVVEIDVNEEKEEEEEEEEEQNNYLVGQRSV